MELFGKSDVGLLRKENQDSYVIGNRNGDFVYAIVCDGMGGANGGAVASKSAVEMMQKRLESADNNSDPKFIISSAIAAANVSVFDKSRKNEALSGMGTTIVAALIKNKVLYLAHAGDSRAYILSDDSNIKPITKDHSVVQELLDNGELSPESAKTFPGRNLITRALGIEPELDFEYTELDLPNKYKILICTDGVTNMIDDDELQSILQNNAEKAVDDIIELANDRGGTDNITAVVISEQSDEVK